MTAEPKTTMSSGDNDHHKQQRRPPSAAEMTTMSSGANNHSEQQSQLGDKEKQEISGIAAAMVVHGLRPIKIGFKLFVL